MSWHCDRSKTTPMFFNYLLHFPAKSSPGKPRSLSLPTPKFILWSHLPSNHLFSHLTNILWKPIVCLIVILLGRVQIFATLWSVAHHAPLSMGFSRQEYWSGLLFSSPVNLPDPGIKITFPTSPALVGRFFTAETPGKPIVCLTGC